MKTEQLCANFEKRIRYLFSEFDNVMIALSASIECSLALELFYRIWKSGYQSRRVCVFNIDTEIAHSYSVLHLMDRFENIKNDFDAYWIMLPTKIKHSLFGKEETLLAWDSSLEKCLRPFPSLPYVITLDNNPISSYRYGMPARMLASAFLKWYKHESSGGRTVCINGARDAEPHNRHQLAGSKKHYRGIDWITMSTPEIWHASPLCDWSTGDVWSTVSRLNIEYNQIYDLLYKRGDALEGFRITPPLKSEYYSEIRRFAELDGIIWDDLTRRIEGLELYSTYSDPRPLFEPIKEMHRMEKQYEKSNI